MSKVSLKSVLQTAGTLAVSALATQAQGHPLDGAVHVPARSMRSPLRPYLDGDWRPATRGDSALARHAAARQLELQAPAARTNITRAVKQPASGSLVVIPLTGCSSEDYIGPMTIANTSTFQVIVDSGSTTAAVADKTCTTCNVSPKYTPGKGASDTGSPVQAQYGLGAWDGEAYSASIRLGNGPSTTVQFGDIQEQQQWFSGGNCLSDGDPSTVALNQGIMGTGPASLALDGTSAYFDSIASDLPANAYAMALCDVGGTMWMGGYDKNAVNGSIVQLPMTQSPYYSVDVTGIQVGGKSAGVTDGDLGYGIVDTGTTQIILPDQAFQSVVQLIVDGSSNHLNSAFFGGETCIIIPSGVTLDEVDAELPKFTLTFGDNQNIGGGNNPDPFSDPYGGYYDDYDGFTAEVPAGDDSADYDFFGSPPPPPTGNAPVWGDLPPSGSPPAPGGSGNTVATLSFPATNSYLMPMLDSKGRLTVCPGLGSAGQEDITILGNTLMHNGVVVFDVAGQQVGWGQGKNTCA